MLVVLTLTMGDFIPAQTEGQSEPAASRRARRTTSPEPMVLEPTQAEPSIRTFTISGRTGLGGVIMHGLPGNPITGRDGTYAATVDYGWSGTVTPAKEGYNFEPASRSYSTVTKNCYNMDYTGRLLAFTISGTTGIGGVIMHGLPGNPVTGRNGTYQATVDYGWSGKVKPTKDGYTFEPSERPYAHLMSNLPNQDYSPKKVGPAPILGRTGGRKVLVIPDSELKPEDLDALTQDLLVMSHILDERFKEPRTIKGVFTDFGDFFGRDSRATEAIYLQGYGTLFLMEVNFAFSTPPKSQKQDDEETDEDVDPTWQRAKQKLFSSKGFGGSDLEPEEQYSEDKIEQIKTEFIRTLKHAANIRNLHPDEWVILTVIGQGRQSDEVFYRYRYPGDSTPRPRISTSRRRRSSLSEEGSMMGGMGVYGPAIHDEMMGGMGRMLGGMAGYGEMSHPSTKVMIIRAKKSDVDDFAKGELDVEQFQETVEIFTY